MNVLFITTGDRTQASSRFRVYELLPHLQERGISTTVVAVLRFDDGVAGLLERSSFASRVLFEAVRSDIVFVQKARLPTWFTTILDRLATQLIYDFDDAIYIAPPGKSVDEDEVERLNHLIQVSDVTIAGSRELVKYARRYTDDVRCLHTGIPRHTYEQHRQPRDSGDNSILLGWIGNPENLHYLADVEEQIADVLTHHENVSLRIITAGELPVRPLDHREGNDVEYVEWTLDSALADLSDVDLGLRPLRDDEWTRAKGGFTSVVECLALGIPVVASPVGLVAHLIRDGENGFLPTAPDEWRETLSAIAERPAQLRPMRNRSVETVSKYQFWSEDVAEGLTRVLRDVHGDLD